MSAKVPPDGTLAPATTQSLPRRAWGAYERGVGSIVGALSRGNGRLGATIARRPWTTILISALVALASCLGWLRFRLETDADVLWVPQKGKARDDKTYVEDHYPRAKQGASFYAQLAPSQHAAFGGDNAVQLPVTWEMFQLHNKVMAISVSDGDKRKTFTDLCYRNLDGSCQNDNGYLWFWYKNFTNYIQAVQGSADNPRTGNETAFRAQVGKTEYPDGKPVSLLSVFGGTTFDFNPLRLKTAQVIASDYTLDDSVSDGVAQDWHRAFTDLMEEQLPKQQYMTFTWITGSSVGDELGKSINNDMFLVIVSLLVFIVIAVVFLSKLNMVMTRTTLALLGVLVTGLGIMAGWGWGMIFGMPFTPLQQLSPFILLGMGIDVVFVLVKSYDIIFQRQPWLTLPEAFSKLMSTAGLSVQVTLLASTVAFALGSVDELPSVIWFAAFAALNTVGIAVLMMTMFIGFMVVTEKRILANRWDCLCCVVRPKAVITPHDTTTVDLPGAYPAADSTAGGGMSRSSPQMALTDDDIKDESFAKKFFRKYYAPALTRWWVKLIFLALFIAAGAISWYGIYQVEYGQPLSDLAPDGSYLQDYDRVTRETYAKQVGEPTGLYFRDLDFSSTDTQYKMLKSWDILLQNSYVNASTTAFLGNWLIDFISWAQDRNLTVTLPVNNCYNPLDGKVVGNLATVDTPARTSINGCIPQAQFYNLLNQWTRGKPNNNIVRRPDGTILSTRFSAMQTASEGNDKYNTRLMSNIRSAENDINDQLFPNPVDSYSAFVFSGNYVFAEGDSILPHSALIYFMLALVGVGVVCIFMLVNPLASILMMIAVGLVVLYLFGELWVFNVKFNQVSVINMVMATGLATDYSVYFAQKFMSVNGDGTGNGRMVVALSDTGSAVFLGGLTALLGSVPMAFSKSVIIRTFFKLIFGTIVFALLVGLLLMPIVFSLLHRVLPPVQSVLMVNSTDDDSRSKGAPVVAAASTATVELSKV